MKIEKRVIREDLETVHARAEEFIEFCEKLGLSRHELEGLIPHPTFEFEADEIFVDETWWIENGKIETSSYRYGVSGWDKERGTYLHYFYHRETDIGQLVGVRFRLTPEIKEKLENLK